MSVSIDKVAKSAQRQDRNRKLASIFEILGISLDEFKKLPDYKREILLDDLETAIQNRLKALTARN